LKARLLALLRPLAILLVAAVIAMTLIRNRPQLEPRDTEVPLQRVDVVEVRRQTLPVTVTAHGNVTAWRQLELIAQVAGRVIWQSPEFEPGVVVEAGTVLLRLDRTDYELALAEARQSLASAELALADARSLRQAARIDEAEATVAAAHARIERAERDLANTEIIAPYAAVIDEQQVELGQFIGIGTVLGRILGAERAEVRLPVAPQDIAFIDPEAVGDVKLYAELGRGEMQWQARLSRVEARVDAQTRVVPVVVTVDDPLDTSAHAQPLPFGLFVRAEIAGGHLDRAVSIPQTALHGDSDVFLLVDGALQRRAVEVARRADGQAYITDGLADGEQVVTTRLELMFEGMKVANADD